MALVSRPTCCLLLWTTLLGLISFLSEVNGRTFFGGNAIRDSFARNFGGGRSSSQRYSDDSSDRYDASDSSYGDEDEDDDDDGIIDMQADNQNKNVNRFFIKNIPVGGGGGAAEVTTLSNLLPTCCCSPNLATKSCNACICNSDSNCTVTGTPGIGFVYAANGVCATGCATCVALSEDLGQGATLFAGCSSTCNT